MLCGTDGTCECRGLDAICYADDDCCDDLVCIAGACRDDTGCSREGTDCTMAAECCGGLVCRDPVFGASQGQCCVAQLNQCLNDTDCCGRMLCVDGMCSCQATGQECATGFDCCAGLSCVSGSCMAVP
jgi:hypothetical protein